MRSFAFLAFCSQLLMVAQQLVLLPLQTHQWGHDITAAWLGALALSAIVPFADLGLRNAGFAELRLAGASARFETLWSVLRLHMIVAAVAAAAVLMVFLGPRLSVQAAPFLLLVGLSSFFDGLFGLRVVWMEALGRITRSELAFFVCLALRVIVGAVLVGVVGVGPVELAMLWCVSGFLALVGTQTATEVRKATPFFLRWRFHGPDLAWSYRQLGWSTPSVLATWAQIHLPVVSLTAFAPAPIVAGFVAIRALYGMLNRGLQQVSRMLSIRFVGEVAERGEERGAIYLLAMAALWAWFVAGATLAIFTENFWLTGPLFDLQNREGFRLLTLTLALSALFSANQIFTLAVARSGNLRMAGVANLVYVSALVGVCGLATALGDFTLLAIGLTACDILLFGVILGLFRVGAIPNARVTSMRFFLMNYTAAAALIALGWAAATAAAGAGYGAHSPGQLALNLALAALVWAAAVLFFFRLAPGVEIARFRDVSGIDALRLRPQIAPPP